MLRSWEQRVNARAPQQAPTPDHTRPTSYELTSSKAPSRILLMFFVFSCDTTWEAPTQAALREQIPIVGTRNEIRRGLIRCFLVVVGCRVRAIT